MLVHGWGRYPIVESDCQAPGDKHSLKNTLANREPGAGLIARGAGRSYGDSAIAESILETRYLDNFIEFDHVNGLLKCEAGVGIADVLKTIVPKGWFLPVVPGTRFPTIGGAVAADVHGKNHHLDGCFSEFVLEFDLLTAGGEIFSCSRSNNPEIFRATCGGMGLTGIILSITLQLKQIPSTYLRESTLVASNLEQVFELFEEHSNVPYSVAWLDCVATNAKQGRSIVSLGEFENDGTHQDKPATNISIPFHTPGLLLNRHSISAFNMAYFNLKKHGKNNKQVHFNDYFFPLDGIKNWNRLYGKKGLIQYQFLLPLETAKEGIKHVLSRLKSSGNFSFLSVLKKFGKANENWLSFPFPGYTLTLDFKFQERLLPFLDELDKVIIDHGGRLYLAKDSRMSKETFQKCYPRWQDFVEVKQLVDPDRIFVSHQSSRLGL